MEVLDIGTKVLSGFVSCYERVKERENVVVVVVGIVEGEPKRFWVGLATTYFNKEVTLKSRLQS